MLPEGISRPVAKPDSTISAELPIKCTYDCGMAVVSNGQDIILGVVTDGDIWRFLLNGGKLDDRVESAMHINPILVKEEEGDIGAQVAMDEKGIYAVLTIDSEGRFVRVFYVSEFANATSRIFSGTVIMAGGKGQRLRPMTAQTPKPMIEVAGKPLIERIVGRLANNGIGNIYAALNYLGDTFQSRRRQGLAVVLDPR